MTLLKSWSKLNFYLNFYTGAEMGTINGDLRAQENNGGLAVREITISKPEPKKVEELKTI